MAIAVYLGAVAGLGLLALQAWAGDLDLAERIGLAYGLGAGALTLFTFLAGAAGLAITPATVAIVYAGLAAAAGAVLAQRWKPLRIELTRSAFPSPIQWALIGLTGAAVLAAGLVAVYWPPYAWDSLAIWVLKAKLIAGTGTLAAQAAANWPFYPLNLPLQLAFQYWISADLLQIIFPVYFASLLLVTFANLRHVVSSTLALACTFFLAVTPIVMYEATVAYADLPFAFYYAASGLYLYRYLRERNGVLLALSGILLGLAGWTRTEAPLYLAINLAVLVLFAHASRKDMYRAIAYAGIYAALAAPWTLYSRLAGYGDYVGTALGGLHDVLTGQISLPLLSYILSYMAARSADIAVWGLLWIGLGAALVIGARHLREHAVLIALIGLNILGLAFTYYSATRDSPANPDWWLSTGADRMALHWAPLVVFFLGVTVETGGIWKAVMALPRVRINPYLVLLVLFSLFAIGPLLGPGYFWGAHDGRHSVYFLFEFDRVIQDGIFYPRWLPDFTFGYGYPFFNIYGPGAFYIGESLHLIGFDFVTATKIVFGAAILFSGVTMFGFVKRLTGSSAAAFLSGLAYVYIPYHIADLYVRAALEESVALVFLPLAVWGFYETVVNPRRTTVVATAMAYGAMMFTHSGITLVSTVILAVWVLFLMIGEVRKKESRIFSRGFFVDLVRKGLPPLGALLLGLGLVAIFFIPAILEYPYVRTDQWIGNYYDYANHFAYWFQLFQSSWGFGISVPGPNDGMSFQLGVVPVVLAMLSLVVVVKNPNGLRRYWIFFLVMTVVVAALTLGPAVSIWHIMPFLAFEQFPWRLESLTTLALAVLAGATAVTLDVKGEGRALSLPTILLGVLIVLGSYPYLTAQMQLQAKEGPVSILGLFRFEQSAGEMTGSTAWVKNIPDWSPMADVYFANKKVKTKIATTELDPDKVWIGVLPDGMGFHTDGERIAYNSTEDNVPITFNIFYYPGWTAYLVKPWSTEIIKPLHIQVTDDLGRIQVIVPKGTDQWLMLRFDDTWPRTAGEWISAGSIFLALGLLIWEVRTQRKQGRALAAEHAVGDTA